MAPFPGLAACETGDRWGAGRRPTAQRGIHRAPGALRPGPAGGAAPVGTGTARAGFPRSGLNGLKGLGERSGCPAALLRSPAGTAMFGRAARHGDVRRSLYGSGATGALCRTCAFVESEHASAMVKLLCCVCVGGCLRVRARVRVRARARVHVISLAGGGGGQAAGGAGPPPAPGLSAAPRGHGATFPRVWS